MDNKHHFSPVVLAACFLLVASFQLAAQPILLPDSSHTGYGPDGTRSLSGDVNGAAAAVIHVPGDFATIQDAVDAAQAGDTILIGSGTFDGAVVRKPLQIKGNVSGTMVEGTVEGGNYSFVVLAHGIEISHLTLNRMLVNGDGVKLHHLSFVSFRSAGVSNYGDGLEVTHSAFSTDLHNFFSIGVSTTGSDTTISHNTFTDLTQGVRCFSARCTVTFNSFQMREQYDFTDHPNGVLIFGSDSLVAFNDFYLESANTVDGSAGIGLFGFDQPVMNNRIEKNNILWRGPNLIRFGAIELVDFTGSLANVTGNIVRHNDLRGSEDGHGPLGVSLNGLENVNTSENNKCDLPTEDACNGL